MRYAFIETERHQQRVGLLCAVTEVACSGYYAWRKHPLSPRVVANAAVRAEIRGKGVPHVQAEVRAYGQVCNYKRVARLMRLEGLQGERKGRKRSVRPLLVRLIQSHPTA